MGKELPISKILITENLACIPAQLSETGETQTIIGHGTFEQNEYRTILRRRIERKHHPFIEVHTFDNRIVIITPDLQERIRLSDRQSKNNFLDEVSYEMFDAKKVIIKS